jgi:hypothetical protein
VADSIDSSNPDLNATQIYYYYGIQLPPDTFTTTNISGDVTVITTINGNSGQATGPTITLSGGSTGYEFIASAGTVSLAVDNATTVRTSISAAESGINNDLTELQALTGADGWTAWTGTPDKNSHVTFSGTASAGYVQAEMQAVMDSLQEVTEGFMALLATLLAWGGARS